MGSGRRRCRMLRWAVGVYLAALLLAVGVVLLAPSGRDVNDATPVRDSSAPLLVAIGDSFLSGEGAGRYLPDTNVPENRCHRATTAHPYLVAKQLGMRLVSAACSGATIEAFYSPQYEMSPRSAHGGHPQLNVLQGPRIVPDADMEPGSPSVVVVSIGGNDAEFGDIVRSCLDSDCRPQLRERTAQLEVGVQQSLARLYKDIRQLVPDDVRVLVMTYPQPVVDVECVPGLSRAETRELTEGFLPRLNEIIRFQASRTEFGFEIVEAENAFVGSRLCESSDPAMNGLKVEPGGGGNSFSGSMHPNRKGHELLAKAVLTQLAQPPVRAGAAMTFPDLGLPPAPTTVPNDASLPPPGPGPTGAPPDPDAPPPGATVPVPVSAPCSASAGSMVVENSRPLAAAETRTTFTADPGSLSCISVGSEDWQTLTADADGRLIVDVSRLTQARVSTIQVLRQVDGAWRAQVLSPPPDVLPEPNPWFSRISSWLLLGLAAPLVVAAAVWWRWCRPNRR